MTGTDSHVLRDIACFVSGLALLLYGWGDGWMGNVVLFLLPGLLLIAVPLWSAVSRLASRSPRRPRDADAPLSEVEFARRCEELMRPKADGSELLPEVLPKSLRDEGFTRDPGLYDHFVKSRARRLEPDVEYMTAAETRALMRDGLTRAGSSRAAQRALEHDWPATARARAIGAGYWTRGDEAYWQEAVGQFTGGHGPVTAKVGPHNRHPKWLVADREFTPHTHCPAGHIATHHVTGRDEHEGQDVVLRECWYEACGLTWAEKAWKVGETA